jgi:deazaflavin-dependent oxidoreductase (nitroreductase family)
MAEMNDFNAGVIEEFRANHGKVGGGFDGAPMVLITTTGAKSGQKRTNPLVSQPSGDVLYIFASKAGAPTNPDWYYNLLAHPEVEVEFGDDKFSAVASTVEGPERDRIYAKQVEVFPGFGDYEKATDRVIPVVELRRTS